MNLAIIGYLLKDRETVVTDKSSVHNAKEEDFEEVRLIIDQETIDKIKHIK